MFRLGITGGIGSGKTTVCRIFEQLGVPVYYADIQAKSLVDSKKELQDEIILAFGEKSFENGVYNRPYIASIVFSDKEKLLLLNSIIHPYVLRDWDEFCSMHSDEVYCIKEAAIMLETDSKKTIDSIVVVYAPQDIRTIRIMKRDGSNPEEIHARMSAQMPEEEKLKLADAVLINDGKQSLIEQVLSIHHQILSGNFK